MWVMNTYGTDILTLDKDSNLWMIIKQHLDLLPNDWRPVQDRSEYISFVLLTDGSNTKAYREDPEKHRYSYRPNMLYRCALTEKGEYIVKRFLAKQFKNTFHNYMQGAMNNNPEMKISEAITEFLMDCQQPTIDKKVIAALTKDWYRYRLKNPDCFKIPIFF